MISIMDLNKEDINFIISIFGIESIRKYFQQHPQKLQKLTPFRAKSLTSDQIYSLIQNNLSSDFIFNFMQKNAERFINQFDEIVKKIEKETEDRTQAFIIALADSPFKDNISLYFKLIDKNIDDEYINLLSVIVNTPDMVKILSAENATDDLSEQVEQLTKQLNEKDALIISGNESLKQTQIDAEHKFADINKQLEKANETIASLKSELDMLKSANQIPEDDIDDGYTYHSICKVYEYNSLLWLHRLADIMKNELVPFKTDESKPPYFGNNIRIKHKSGPDELGYIGIWAWNVEENRNNPNIDYVKSSHCKIYIPIEVIDLSGSTSIETLIDYLKNGVEQVPSSSKALFSVKTNSSQYCGILCSSENWKIRNGVLKLNSECYSVFEYLFDENDTIKLERKRFYRFLNIKGIPKTIKLYDPIKIVKDIILKRASWNALKQKGVSKNVWKICRDYISELPQDDLYKEICDNCKCSESEAKQYVASLIESAETYINNDNIENDIIASIIPKHPEIVEKCKELIHQEWKAENEVKITVANDELQAIENKVSDKSAELEIVQKEHDRLSAELTIISDSISEKEKLASDVDERIRNKINDAKKNAADFISQMAFVSPVSYIYANNSKSCYITGNLLNSENIEEYDNVNKLHSLISEELQNAGVSSKFRDSLAAYMYSAYLTHTPLLLAGPCGKSIANAFSAALNAKLAGVLNCSNPYDSGEITEAVNNSDKVVIIENPFNSEWIYSIMDIINTPDKFFILVTPFMEDLSIEPKGLLNYFLPIFTELFIDSEPTNAFFGSKASEGYIPRIEKKANSRPYNQLLFKMKISSLAVKRINAVIEQAASLYEISIGTDLVFVLLPCAYITGTKEKLLETIHNQNNPLSKVESEYIKLSEQYLGECDE